MNAPLPTRRQFLQRTAAVTATCMLAKTLGATEIGPVAGSRPEPTAAKLPRWRGFNLLEKFTARKGGNPPFAESDFAWIAGWGFDFVRLPMSYHCWSSPEQWLTLREGELAHIDQAVEFGRHYGVHVNLNFHRAPGYCVNPPAEPLDLFADEAALEAAAFHWAHFARRYRGIPNTRLSFDLLNEPKDLPEDLYFHVVQRLVAAIRAEDPHRLIIADGLKYGTKPAQNLVPLRIAQSTRGYQPMQVSHYQASWMKSQDWAEPTWPLTLKPGNIWDRERLHRENIAPWQALEKQGVGVHVGEWGAYRYTPHAVALRWMQTNLALWRDAGWGWAMWNFRGDFGPLDSKRSDVPYETFHGHQLDRAMLEMIRAY